MCVIRKEETGNKCKLQLCKGTYQIMSSWCAHTPRAQKVLRAVMGEGEKHSVQKIMSGWVYAGARVQSGAGHVPTRSQSKVERVEIRTTVHEHPAHGHDKFDDWVQFSNSAPIFVQSVTILMSALVRLLTAVFLDYAAQPLRHARPSVSLWKKSCKGFA